ncbi:MAG TPA: SUMF1/EgtB/PvdO family nonheme iron enzyme, partial [Pyrinomonadaceae bacterium]
AESETRKREQEAVARQKAENSARSLLEKAKQEEASSKTGNGAVENGNDAVTGDNSQILPQHSFNERQKHTQAQISIETTANVFDTNSIPERNLLKKSALYAAFPILIAAAVGFYVVYKPISGALINNGYFADSNTSKNIDSGNKDGQEFSKNNAVSIGERLKNKMVKINGGTFQMGRNDVSPTEAQFYGTQFPAHPISVADFYLDQTEVTNEEYAEFVAETGHAAPDYWQNGKPSDDQKKLPVTNVAYFDARDFAGWVSKQENTICRLPSEEEWEYAARSGAQQNVFPWGNDWIAGRANVATGKLMEVGVSGDVTNLWKIKDMMGNVIEWTSSPFGYYPNFPENIKDSSYKNSGKFTLRGLSFSAEGNSLKKTNLNFTYRQPASGGIKKNFIGFRLACDSK